MVYNDQPDPQLSKINTNCLGTTSEQRQQFLSPKVWLYLDITIFLNPLH
jgi:hypothetical protein